MKTLVPKTYLKEGLEVAGRVVGKSPSLPILQNILLSTEKERVKISSTDLQMGVTYQFLGTTKEEGAVVFPAQLLSPLLALSEEEKVSLVLQERTLFVEVGRHRASVKTVEADEFPIIPSLKGGESSIQVETQVLCKELSKVVGMVGQTQARPEICGVLFCFGKAGGRLVATDSFRLAECVFPFLGQGNGEQGFILPSKTARELVAIFGERPAHTTIYFTSSQAVFVYEDGESPSQVRIEFVSRLIEGEYPHYEEVIPSTHSTVIRARKNELINHIRAAGVFAGKTQGVRIQADPRTQEVVCISESVEAGNQRSFLKGEVTGEYGEAAFNWRFLTDGLAHIQGERIELGMNGEEGPALLRPVEEGGYRYVLMPIKA